MSRGTTLADTPVDFLVCHWRLILVSLLGWSLLAAIPATSAYLGSGATGFGVWWAMFKRIGLYYYLWGLAAPLLYRVTDHLRVSPRGLVAALPVHGLILVTLSFAFGFVAHQSAWREWLLGSKAVGYHSMSFFTYALIVLCALSIQFYRLSLLRQREASAAKIQAAQLDSQLNLARVDSLRMQMNPHFLFNALNSVAALVDAGRTERAYDALDRLGTLLRQALRLSREVEVNLSDELAFCKAYLEIEQLRFGERLDVVWYLGDALGERRVPAFVLQPAIENAIKHAVSRSTTPVTVSIDVRAIGASLQITVTDSGQAPPPAGASSGVGLENLRERLRLRYGGRASVTSGRIDGGFRTRIVLPADA